MRRTLRRNQAITRPPPSRTRLSSPQSHVICSPRFHIKPPLSRRTTLQFGLHAWVISHCGISLQWRHKRRTYYDGHSQTTMAIAIGLLQEGYRTTHIWTNWNRPMSCSGTIRKAFTAAGDFVGCTPLISLASPFISGLRRIMHAYFLPWGHGISLFFVGNCHGMPQAYS